MDTQDDFNTGKDGRNALRPIKYLHTKLLSSITKLLENTVFTEDERLLLSQLQDVSPDELAVGTLKKMVNVCEMLHIKEKTIRCNLPTISFTTTYFTKDMPIDCYYSVCYKLGIPFPEEYNDYNETINILHIMDNLYIREPKRLMYDLNNLVEKVFNDVKPIIVDKNKGYMILNDISYIKFLRITRGHPRFKLLF